MRTLFHEMVGHYGLRKLLGQRNYDNLCAMVYDKMSSNERNKWRKYAERELKGNEVYEAMTNEKKELAIRQTAADEYMASLAENGCTRPQLSTWQRIKQFIRDVLRRMRINVNLSDYDIAMLLYESKMNIGDRAITEEEQAELDRIRTIVADRMEKNETVGTRFGVRKMEDYNEGDFGPIYTQFENKPNEAVEYLKKVKKGEAVRALYHKSVGYIDIVWGSEGTGKSDGYGLAKLVKFHPEVVDRLQEIINEMDVVSRSENRVNLESDRYRAGIRFTWNDKKKTWLLTAYEKENSASNNRTDTDGTINDSRRNDTATPQDTVSIDKGTTNSGREQTNSEKNSENLQGGEDVMFKIAGTEKDVQLSSEDREILKGYNDKFNEDLQKQIKGTLPSDYVYSLGRPLSILRATGIPDLPIELKASKLREKSEKEGHTFNLRDVFGLVDSMQNPYAVFRYGDDGKSQNIILEISKNGKQFLVGLFIEPKIKNRVLSINDVRTVFPKDNTEWLNWITEGKLLYGNTQKIKALIDKQRINLAEVEYLDLNSVAKVLNNFGLDTTNSEKNSENLQSGEDVAFAIIENGIGRSLTADEAMYVISNIEKNAIYPVRIELTEQNWLKEFASVTVKKGNNEVIINSLVKSGVTT